MVSITINGTTLNMTPAGNSASQALVDLLCDGPFTVSLHEYGGFEQVGSLPTSLPTEDTQITTEPGDVILYQGNQVSIMYGNNSWSYTRLGKNEDVSSDELRELLSANNVEATFALVVACQ